LRLDIRINLLQKFRFSLELFFFFYNLEKIILKRKKVNIIKKLNRIVLEGKLTVYTNVENL